MTIGYRYRLDREFWAAVEADLQRFRLEAAQAFLAAAVGLLEGIVSDAAFLDAYNATPIDRWADDGGRMFE